MKNIFRRLKRLEAATARLFNGPWHWPARAAEVKTRTMEALSAEERALVTESFGGQQTVGLDAFRAMHPGVWIRYNEAFDRATREVPAPYVMSICDLWGCW